MDTTLRVPKLVHEARQILVARRRSGGRAIGLALVVGGVVALGALWVDWALLLGFWSAVSTALVAQPLLAPPAEIVADAAVVMEQWELLRAEWAVQALRASMAEAIADQQAWTSVAREVGAVGALKAEG